MCIVWTLCERCVNCAWVCLVYRRHVCLYRVNIVWNCVDRVSTTAPQCTACRNASRSTKISHTGCQNNVNMIKNKRMTIIQSWIFKLWMFPPGFGIQFGGFCTTWCISTKDHWDRRGRPGRSVLLTKFFTNNIHINKLAFVTYS